MQFINCTVDYVDIFQQGLWSVTMRGTMTGSNISGQNSQAPKTFGGTDTAMRNALILASQTGNVVTVTGLGELQSGTPYEAIQSVRVPGQ